MDPLTAAALLLLGFASSALGTLIGVGGGFMVVPVFLVAFPRFSPAEVTGISLAAVFLGSLSGVAAYARLRRIDYRLGLVFALGTVPGAAGGALLVRVVAREPFQVLFGVVLGLVGAYLAVRPSFRPPPSHGQPNRVLVDRSGQRFTYRVAEWKGLPLSLLIGVLSALLGVGGGVFQVPAMVAWLGVPPLVAAATSVFILAFTSASATVTHVLAGHLHALWPYFLLLAVGMIGGAQVGGRLARRASGTLVVRLLGAALGGVGLYLVLTGVGLLGR
jgi:uncharacterized membrane protein YfcA